MASNKPPAVKITGIRGSIPTGYLLGRTSAGHGDVELISAGKAQAVGLIPSTLPGPPTGAAGGDLTGTYPNPTVAQLQGVAVQAGVPSNLAVLLYHTLGATWLPVVLATVSYTGNYSDLSGLPAIHNIPAAGTTGQVLTKNSAADYDASWVTPSAGGSGGGAASIQDDGTAITIALSDGDGQMVLDGAGDPVFVPEVFPAASLPVASSSALGIAKVDGFSLQAVAGLIGTLFSGASLGMLGTQNLNLRTPTTLKFDVATIDTMSGYNATNGRYTPTKPGKYFIVFSSYVADNNGSATLTYAYSQIYKNTTRIGENDVTSLGAGAGVAYASSNMNPVALVTMNGTTDYFEIKTYYDSTGGSGVGSWPITATCIIAYLGA